jgi:hypothetical protein
MRVVMTVMLQYIGSCFRIVMTVLYADTSGKYADRIIRVICSFPVDTALLVMMMMIIAVDVTVFFFYW